MLALLSLLTLAADPGYTWRHCEQANRNRSTIPFNKEGDFIPQCAPDTLYAWQECWKIENWAKTGTPEDLFGGHYTYSWRTPIGSHGYGQCSARIKLKEGVKFKYGWVDCKAEKRKGERRDEDMIKASKEEVVWVNHINHMGFDEYIICNPDVIHSWSWGTKEHQAEMDRELAWIKTHGNEDYDRIQTVKSVELYQPKEVCPFETRVDYREGTDWSWANLQKGFTEIRDRMGEIHYGKGVTPDRDAHFTSKDLSFFHPTNPQ